MYIISRQNENINNSTIFEIDNVEMLTNLTN